MGWRLDLLGFWEASDEEIFLAVNTDGFHGGCSLGNGQGRQDINCCVKGKCSKMTTAKCDKAKGEIVKDCKDCKKPAKTK